MEEYLAITQSKKAKFPDLAGRKIKTVCLKRFTAIPPSIAGAHVRCLILSSCKLTSLPETLGKMRSLEELSFVDCDMSALPAAAFAPPGLEELSVFHDRDTLLTDYPPLSLPAPLPAHPTLKRLSLSGYIVAEIPDGIAGYPALEELTVIPLVRRVSKALGRLRKLRSLNLLKCDLEDFASTLQIISKLPLRALSLSNIVVDPSTRAHWAVLGKTLTELHAHKFAMVAPGAKGRGPQVARDFDREVLQRWLPRAKIR